MPLGQPSRMIVTLPEREHLVRELERGPIVAAQQLGHPLPADHRHHPVVVAGSLARRPGSRVRLVDARGGIAMARLERRREVGQELDALELVTGVRIRFVERLQAAPEVLGRLQIGRSLEGACPRGVPEVHRAGGLIGAGPVVRNDLGLPLSGVREAPHERVRDLAVERVSAPAQDPPVGRLLEERVRELPAPRQPDDRPQYVLGPELSERRLEIPVARRDHTEQRPVELAAEDRGDVDHVGEVRQPIEPLGEEPVERRRHRRGGGHASRRVHLQHLLHEQRDAVGGGVEPVQDRGVERRVAGRCRHGPHLAGRQRSELDLEHLRALRPGRLELGPEREHAQDGEVRQAPGDPPEQLHGRRIGPVHVLHDEQQRVTCRVRDEQRLENSHRRGAGFARGEARRAGHAADGQELRDERHGLRRIEAGVGDRLLEQLHPLPGRVRPLEAQHALE